MRDRFADVWSVRDFIAAVAVLAGVLLVGAGTWLGPSVLATAGAVVVLAGAAVFVAGRLLGRPGRGRHDDWV